MFKKDEQGRNRDWTKIEESKIRELYTKCKREMEEVIAEFKYIKLPKTTPSINQTPDGETHQAAFPLSRSLSIQYKRLLSETDINKVKDKFNEDTEFVLEEAIRKHHNIQSSKIPWWIIALLIFFAFDNVVAWLASPFIFYPLTLIIGFVAMLFSMGMGGMIIPVARQTINMGFR